MAKGMCLCVYVCMRVCNVCVVVRGLVTVSQQGIQAVVGVGMMTFSQPTLGQRLSAGESSQSFRKLFESYSRNEEVNCN